MSERIELNESELVIRDLVIREPDTVDVFRETDAGEPPDEVRLALRIGAMMLQRVDASAQADFLEKRVAEIVGTVENRAAGVMSNVEGTIRRTFDPEEADSAIAAVRRAIEHNLLPLREAAAWVKAEQSKLDGQFNPANSDGYAGRMLGTFEKLETRFKAMFDPESKTSFPTWIETELGNVLGRQINGRLAEIHGTTREELQKMRVELEKMRAARETLEEVASRTPLKGGSFEQRVLAVLETIAEANGDIVADTTAVVGEVNGSKKGDFAYDVGGRDDRRIAIECKDTTMASCPKVLADMARTMANRKAAFGIHVVAEAEQLQKQIGSWQVYRDRNLIITHADMLEPSLRIARLLLELDAQSVDGLDLGVIDAQLTAITAEAARSRQAKTKLSNIEDAVSALRQLEDERSKRINAAIGLIREELGRADREAA